MMLSLHLKHINDRYKASQQGELNCGATTVRPGYVYQNISNCTWTGDNYREFGIALAKWTGDCRKDSCHH